MFVVIRKINSQGWIWKVDPQGVQSAPPPTTDRPDEGGRNLRGPTEGRPKAPDTGRKEKCVDLGGHVKTRIQESLRAPRSCEGPGPHSEVGMRHCGEFKRQLETAGRGGRQGGGDATWVRPPLNREAWHRVKGWYRARSTVLRRPLG